MQSPAAALAELGRLDRFAEQQSAIHALDARGKLLLTFAYLLAVLSLPADAVGPLLPLAVLPFAAAGAARLPLRYLLTRILWVLPFVLLMALSNAWFDRMPVARLGPLAVTHGLLTGAALLLRAALCVAAATVLVATTGINPLARALAAMGVPRVFAVQLLMLYRYLFLLMEQLAKLRGACALRSAGRPLMLRAAAALLAQLLLRSIDRAARVHYAMRSRGFDGTVRPGTPLRWTRHDAALTGAGLALLLVLRIADWGRLAGLLLYGGCQ